ncbi:MAG TPA: hypothetical protein VGF99_13490, partial [Myxococcota bacterium]
MLPARHKDVVTTALLVGAVLSSSPAAAAKRATPKTAVESDPPVIVHDAPVCAPPVEGVLPPCIVAATITDESGVFDPTLLVRLRGVSAYDRVAMKPVVGEPDRYAAAIPSAIAAAGDVEYLIEAFDEQGNGPARAGTENAPLLVVKPVAAPVVAPVVEPPPVEDDGNALFVGGAIGVGVLAVVVVGAAAAYAVYALRPAAVDEV